MLATEVNSTEHLMSIALQAEREAIRRYTQLAASMHTAGNDSAAALFERMVDEEQGHEQLLMEWMSQQGINEDPAIGPISWRDPQVSTTYDDEARDPYYSTPYRALAFAVHNEEIAFRFYTHVAAHSEDRLVREYAEVLAREELGHAALLRAERRLAYHAEREASTTAPRLEPSAIHNESDLLAAAIHIDKYLASEMNAMVNTAPEMEALARETLQRVVDYENTLRGKNPPGDDITSSLRQLAEYNKVHATHDPDSTLQRLWASCDRSFAFYDAIVETSTDEAIMHTAQTLTSTALDRIGILKQIFEHTPAADSSNH